MTSPLHTHPRRAFIAFALPFLALSAWLWARALSPVPLLTVTFLDVGQGDSIIVRTPAGHTLIVDAGRASPYDDEGRRVVVPFLRTQGINSVDALLLTHPDDDHVGGASSILERVRVGRVLISGLTLTSASYTRALNTARRLGVPIVTVRRGQKLDFRDGVVADVLNPPGGDVPPDRAHADNNGSLVVRVREGETAVMLTGDAEEPAEQDIIASGLDLRADVLKLGHHGSRTSSSEEFLDAVHPKLAIVSAGIRNQFGHPHPEVLQRLATRGIRVLRTDLDGAITITSDGHTLRATTALSRGPYGRHRSE